MSPIRAADPNKETKTLDYRIISDLPILLERPNDDLKVTYRDEEVKHPRIVAVRFMNTGKQVIRDTDILDPYIIQLDGTSLLDTAITAETGRDLADFNADECSSADGTLQLTIRTLNPGDTFTIHVITDSESPTRVHVSGRIENETRPTAIYPTKFEIQNTREYLSIGFIAATVLFGLAFFTFRGQIARGTDTLSSITMGCVALAIGLWTVIGWQRSQTKLFKRLGHKR